MIKLNSKKSVVFYFISLFFISSVTSSSFALELDSSKTNDRLFIRYARPQLRMIRRSFYEIVKVFPGATKLLTFRESLNEMHNHWEELYKECPDRIDSNCQEKLEVLFSDASDLEMKIMKIMSDEEIYKTKSSIHIKRLFFGKIFLETESLSSKIKYCTTSLILREDSRKCSSQELSKDINTIRTIYQQALINTLPPSYREHFERLYMHFIIPIEQKVLRKNNKDYLYKNLNGLNMIWNQFHLALTRRGIVKVEESTESKLKTMHGRWNSILKMVLKR